MTDMRLSFYVALMMLVWAIVVLADDPYMRLNDVLKNDTSLHYYANCFLDRGPCPSEGRTIKRLLPEFISTSCAKCSDRNKQMACRVLFTLKQDKYSDLWVDFLNKYDPYSQYRINLDNFLQSCRENGNF